MPSQSNKKNIEKLQKIREFKIDKVQIELNKSHQLLRRLNTELQDLILNLKEFHSDRLLIEEKKFHELRNNTISANNFLEYRTLIVKKKKNEEGLEKTVSDRKHQIDDLKHSIEIYKKKLRHLNKKLEGLKLINP